MKKLLTSIEHITRSKACRITFTKWGKHRFGGSPKFIYSGIEPPAPIHHLFTMDTHDSHTPVVFDAVRYLPLLFPLSYSMGGGHMSYQVVDDSEIRITSLSTYHPDDPLYFPFDPLPERMASLTPLSYAERRILGSDICPRSFLDRRRMNRLWNGECFRISGMLHYDSEMGLCSSDHHSQDGERERCNTWRFAAFPASRIPFGNIWHEYSNDTQFCFSLCFKCGTIYAYSQCD